MVKLTKRAVDAAVPGAGDYILWDDDLPGFGLRVFGSGKRSYLIQYRSSGRTRRYTIGAHGVWTPEMARQEAKAQLGRVARGENPSEERHADLNAMTVQMLCGLYRQDLDAGLIRGKGGRPKKPSTVATDIGRIDRHILPLIGTRRVKDLTKADIAKVLKDILTGKTRVPAKGGELDGKANGKAVVRGGAGAAARTVGLLSGILTYAVEAGIITTNPAHGVRKPRDNVRTRRLSEAEYRALGRILHQAAADERYNTTIAIIRLIALTGCRRGEIINLQWSEVDDAESCLRLEDSKEGASIRPVGLPVLEALEAWEATRTLQTPQKPARGSLYVFPAPDGTNAYGSFPFRWKQLFCGTPLSDVTPHVLRHSFASMANDLGFTEATIAALVGHARGSVTGNYIHTLDTALITAADTISGYIDGLLKGTAFRLTAHPLDRQSRKAALTQFLQVAMGKAPCSYYS